VTVFAPSSRGRLTDRDLDRFPETTLFGRLARAVCHAGCLPRKELFESWEMARRVRRLFRGGRVVDLGAGHGLLAHLMLLLDDSSADAIVVDPAPALSGAALHQALVEEWPRLRDRVTVRAEDLQRVRLEPTDLLVSSHACGALTDRILDAAIAVNAPVAALPCCHDLAQCDAGPLGGWLDGPMAVDAMRAVRLASHGYRVRTQTIPRAITPKNRLLIGTPRS